MAHVEFLPLQMSLAGIDRAQGLTTGEPKVTSPGAIGDATMALAIDLTRLQRPRNGGSRRGEQNTRPVVHGIGFHLQLADLLIDAVLLLIQRREPRRDLSNARPPAGLPLSWTLASISPRPPTPAA
jgi:hypothetical protein